MADNVEAVTSNKTRHKEKMKNQIGKINKYFPVVERLGTQYVRSRIAAELLPASYVQTGLQKLYITFPQSHERLINPDTRDTTIPPKTDIVHRKTQNSRITLYLKTKPA